MFTNRSVLLSSKTSVQRSYHRLINCENLSAANNSKSSYNNRQEGILKNSIPTNSVIRRTYFNYVNRPNNKSEANFVRGSHSNLCGQRNDILKIRNKVDLRSLSTATEPRVIATPRVCMHDVKTSIKVEGLPPNQPVTVRMALTEDRGKRFCSYAHFNSDKDGKVDLSTMPSLGGTYTGLVSSGLLMSLRAAPGEFKYARLVKEKIEEPLKIDLTVHLNHESFEEESLAVSSTVLVRYFVAPGVEVIPVRYKKVRGMLFLPPGPGPFPGVIDMYGGAGGLIKNRPALMSAHGIACLALAYFNYDDLPTSPDIMELEYFEEAVEFLTSQDRVVSDRCGVVGHCQGASFALVLASHLEKVKSIVAINASPSPFEAQFTYKGEVIQESFFGPKTIDDYLYDEDIGEWPLPDVMDNYNTNNPSPIPIEKGGSDIHYYFIYSGDDPYRLKKGSKCLTQKLDSVNNRNYVVETYKDAGHMIDAPYIAYLQSSFKLFTIKQKNIPARGGKNRSDGQILYWGGNVAGTSSMQENTWPKILAFVKQHNRDESISYQKLLESDGQK